MSLPMRSKPRFSNTTTEPPDLKVKALVSAIAVASCGLTTANAQHIEEIIVTSTRRTQSVQEVPYNISVFGGADLENSSLINGDDLLQQIPGVFVSSVGGRTNINSNISIRGIMANNPMDNSIVQNLTEPPVATYIGDTPIFLNFKLTDIDRIEILRGPQGTLYGSGAVGGTVRYIFNKPDLEKFSASISARTSISEDSDEFNYGGDIIVNAPFSDKFALRVVGGGEDLGGFVDARGLFALDSELGPATPSGDYLTSGPFLQPTQKNTNDMDNWYIRGMLYGELTDNVSVLLTYMHQEDNWDGDSARGISDLVTSDGPKNVHDIDNDSFGEHETDLVSLEATVDMGFATLTSSTAYTEGESDNYINSSGLYYSLEANFGTYFGFPRITALSPVVATDKVFTQELRLVSQGDSKIDWILGGFYKDQSRKSVFTDTLFGFNDWLIAGGLDFLTPVDPIYNDTPYEFVRSVDFEDIAVFGELGYHITDAWQVTGGIRVFWQDFSQDARIRFPYCSFYCASDGADLLGTTQGISDDSTNDYIFKVNTSYDFHDDHMAYFTFSQGFRHGGANALPTTGPFAVDASLIPYDADEVDNWEVGLKGNLADGKVAYTLSLFRADWDKIQLDAYLGPLLTPSVVNGESARSQGLELEMRASPNENLDLNFSYNFTDAELRDNTLLADVPVSKGDAIPGVSEHAFSIFADYTMPLTNGSKLLFHVDGSYRSDFETSFNPAHLSYAKLDGFEVINLALNWSMDKFVVGLYVNNLTNEEGVAAVSTQQAADFLPSAWAFLMRTRTIGISGSYRF